MSFLDRPTLSPTYFDPEAEPVPEPEPTPEPPKRRGRPPGSKSKPKPKPKSIPWFNIFRAVFWSVASVFSLTVLYFGVQTWLGQGAAYLSVAVATPVVAFLLDRDWKKMRA